MEVNSGSSTNSGQADSLHGLKFGQKIYFEAAGGGGSGGGRGQQQGKQSSGSKAQESGRPPPAPAAKKGRSGAVPGGGGQPPRCQVEGCKVDLSDAKTYYSRHKVCATHSKSPQVVVGGIQQRFCQQCSRFHLLPEFDQGKRSCRRRLAGHNERRRKPQPGNLLSTRYGTLSSSSYFETNSRPGSFVMDFTSYPSLSGRDSWPNARTSELVTSNRPPTATGKSLQHPWQNNHEGPPELLMQCSASRSTYVASGMSSGECYAGVSDSSRALSLLSTQSWGSRNESLSLGVNGLLDANGTPTVRPSGSHGEANNYFSHSSLWGFKGCENSSTSSHEMPPDLGLRQVSQAANNQYSCDVDASRQNGRECLELEHSRGYESPVQNMHWSL